MKGLLSSVASFCKGVGIGMLLPFKWAWNCAPMKALRFLAGDPALQRNGLTMEKAETAPEVEPVDTGVEALLEQQMEAKKQAEPGLIFDFANAPNERARQEITKGMTDKTATWCRKLETAHLEAIRNMGDDRNVVAAKIRGHMLGTSPVASIPSMRFGLDRNTQFDVARAVSQVRKLNREETRVRKTPVDPMMKGADTADVHKSAAKRVLDDQANGNSRKPQTAAQTAAIRQEQRERGQIRKAARTAGVSIALTPAMA